MPRSSAGPAPPPPIGECRSKPESATEVPQLPRWWPVEKLLRFHGARSLILIHAPNQGHPESSDGCTRVRGLSQSRDGVLFSPFLRSWNFDPAVDPAWLLAAAFGL
jgi:hypothetical protein